ncbi:MAG: hypothetical protein RL670_375 [Actinomycetota bacterium]|jgi:hypothetical protein
MIINRWIMGVPAIFFALYQAILAALAMPHYREQWPVWAAIAVYLACSLCTIVFYYGLRLPMPQTILNVLVAALIPVIVNSQISTYEPGSHATWYVEGVAIILALNAVRGHRLLSYIGLAILWFQVIFWAGTEAIFTSGLIGATLLVFAGTAASVGFNHLDEAMELDVEREAKLAEQAAVREAAISSRRELVNENLRGALPFLEKIAEEKKFNVKERKALAAIAESIRDRQAGGRLMSAQLLQAISNCRDRGVEVQLVAGFQLDDLSDLILERLRARLIEEIGEVQTGRIIIRSLGFAKQKIHFLVTQSGDPRPLFEAKF